jgi:hypothetical protein
LPAAAGAERTVDYLYIRASEGGSSGGHAAIRFDEWTFDFQHAAGLLEMRRQDSGRFQYVYRALQNRSIERSRIAVSDDTYTKLRSGFQQRFLVQERQGTIAESIAEDARVLEALLAQQGGEARGLALQGPGFFFADGAPVPAGADAPASAGTAPRALAALRARIEARHGAGFLAGRWREVRAALASLRAAPVDADAVAPDPRRLPVAPDTFARRYENALAASFALALLEAPRPLRAQALAPAADADPLFALDASAAARLREAAEALTEDLARLAASPRPDWGGAMLLGAARLAAVEASVESGRLVLLDAYPESSRSVEITARRRALLPELAGEAAVQLTAARAAFLTASGWQEASYQALEESGNRWLELRSARAGASALRVDAGPLVPAGRARVRALPMPGDDVPLAVRLAQARAAQARHRAALERSFGYDLVRRNCVTEIFRTLEAALGEAAAGVAPQSELARLVRQESARRLGGYLAPSASANFIPFVSSQHVRTHYAVEAQDHLAGHREQRVAEMAAREGRLRVALRESNVATATAYRAGDDDGFFLFFTDGEVPLRPLLGVLNLAAGLGRTALGVLALPLDRGRGVRAGLEGAFWSLPELVFLNVRKGSNEWVRPALRPPPG